MRKCGGLRDGVCVFSAAALLQFLYFSASVTPHWPSITASAAAQKSSHTLCFTLEFIHYRSAPRVCFNSRFPLSFSLSSFPACFSPSHEGACLRAAKWWWCCWRSCRVAALLQNETAAPSKRKTVAECEDAEKKEKKVGHTFKHICTVGGNSSFRQPFNQPARQQNSLSLLHSFSPIANEMRVCFICLEGFSAQCSLSIAAFHSSGWHTHSQLHSC